MSEGPLTRTAPLFRDRVDAGEELALALGAERTPGTIVVGVARGGVEVAAEVARHLDAPLDVLAARKIRHPWHREYGLGAVTPDGRVYLHPQDELDAASLRVAREEARREAVRLDARLHEAHEPLSLRGRAVVLVDDGLAGGATMISALRWARAAGAARVVAAVPIATDDGLDRIRPEADEVVCPNVVRRLHAIEAWYSDFRPVEDGAVVDLLAANRRTQGTRAQGIRTQGIRTQGIRRAAEAGGDGCRRLPDGALPSRSRP